MLKLLFSFIFIFLATSVGELFAQTSSDSSVNTGDTISFQKDSSYPASDSLDTNRNTGGAADDEDSVYKPRRDSQFIKLYTFRGVSKAKADTYLTDRDYEYANDPEYWVKDKVQKDTRSASFWNFLKNKIVKWVILIALVVLVVYILFLLFKENGFRWFNRTSKPLSGAPDSKQKTSVNFEECIRLYQSEGNYRMAVQYLYLRLIHLIDEQNIVRIHGSMTNAEITRGFGQHPLTSQFRYLASAYEYIYFGDFKLNTESFEELKNKFEMFQQKLSA